MLIVSVTYLAGERIARAGGSHDTAASAESKLTVIIDAGHGGMDGGASTEDGVLEKHLNLAVAKQLEALLLQTDLNVVMTRREDVMLADEGSSHKKRDDLNARLAIAEKYENCIFVSIHMNKYPVAKYSGLQVYYSPNNGESARLAQILRSNTVEYLQRDNCRNICAADSSIYILDNINAPAVLVECGFLSNPEEAALLCTAEYQNKLAALVFASVLEYARGAGE